MFNNDPELRRMFEEVVAQYEAVAAGIYDGPRVEFKGKQYPNIDLGPLLGDTTGMQRYARSKSIQCAIERRLAHRPCAAKMNLHADGQIVWRCPECGRVDHPCERTWPRE